MDQKSNTVFVSYCRKDKKRVTAMVKEIEEQSGASCWLDINGIESGLQFEDVIINAINQALVVLVMISENVEDSVYVKREIDYAISKGKRIIPIRLDNSEWPDWVRFKFNGVEYVDPSDRHQYNKLISTLKKCNLENTSGKTEMQRDEKEGVPSKLWIMKNWRAWLGVVGIVLIVVVFLVWLTGQKDQQESVKSNFQQEQQDFRIPEQNEGGEFYTENLKGVPFTMIKVEGGTYRVGNPKTSDSTVTLASFYIGETEVTQALWEAVMNDNPSWFKERPNHPVEQVTYDSCLIFVNRLSELKGRKFRLPTEAEWEVAARGGNKSKGYIYSGSDSLADCAWFWRNSGKEFLSGSEKTDWTRERVIGNGGQTHEVKTRMPNELGIYDMSGNVEEWCFDLYYKDGRTRGERKLFDYVFRGGSWCCVSEECKVYSRYPYTQNMKHRSLGLRLASDN